MPTATLTYKLGGPVNNGPGWFPRDNNNFAPRLSMAYAPEGDGILTKILGKGSVLRGGAGVIYDHYGTNMVTSFASSGSPGLSTTVSQPLNTDFSTSFRYNGGALPAIPPSTATGFPYTPPLVIGGFTSFSGVSSNLAAPYEYLLNFSYARPLAKKVTIEVGYIGRLSHKGLMQQDFAQPLTLFKDVKSGQTWSQAGTLLKRLYDSGITPAQVQANPNLIPQIPFFEDIFPGAKNYKFNGSASANYYYTVYGTYAGSDLDALNDMDRLRQSNGSCISVYGCNTFFANQPLGHKPVAVSGTERDGRGPCRPRVESFRCQERVAVDGRARCRRSVAWRLRRCRCCEREGRCASDSNPRRNPDATPWPRRPRRSGPSRSRGRICPVPRSPACASRGEGGSR